MESLRRQLRNLTVPIFMEIALVMLVGFVDTIMLSRVGNDPAGAVGFVNMMLIGPAFLVYQFVSVGAGIVCAQYFAAGHRQRLVQIVGLALALSVVFGFGVSALLYFKADTFLAWIDISPDQFEDAKTYLEITGGLSFFQAVGFIFSSSLRSVDKVKAPMYVTVLANILNALGNYALIFGNWGCPELGVAGAAWATALSRVVSFVLMGTIHTVTHIRVYPLRWFYPFPWRELKNLVKIGIPAMSEELSYCLSQVVIGYFINQIGKDAMTTRTYVMNSVMFVFLFCAAITQGGDILVGHLVGRDKYRPAYLVGTFFLRWSMVITLACSVALACAGPWLLDWVSHGDRYIVETGSFILWIDVLLEVGRVRNIFACGTLRAAGDAVFPVMVGVTVQWTVAVGFAWCVGMGLHGGLIAFWCAFALDENLRGIILMRRWHTMGWVGKNLVRS